MKDYYLNNELFQRSCTMKRLYTFLIYYFSVMIVFIVVESILQRELEISRILIVPLISSIIMIAFKKQE